MFASLFTFDAGDIATTTAYIGDIFTDVKPLFFLIVGLSIGFWIIGAIVNVIRPQKER